MKVFISWSGAHSQAVARTLRDWLPDVIQSVEPWMSEADIHAGDRWNNEIAHELQASSFGIICVTPSNQNSPWLNFEAGAISKNLEEGYAVPYLHALTIPNMISGPLRQFHSKEADRKGTLELVQAINNKLAIPVSQDRLQRIFEAMWPQLEDALNAIQIDKTDTETAVRSADDKVDEILGILLRKEDSSSIQDLVRQVRTLGIIVSRGGWNFENAAAGVEEAIFQMLSLQMRAFLKPAKFNYSPNGKIISFIFSSQHLFHYKQAKGKIEEIQMAVDVATQYRCKVKIVGPEDEDLPFDDFGASPNEEVAF